VNAAPERIYEAARPREAVVDAKDWLLDVFEHDEDAHDEIRLLTAATVIPHIERIYFGGWTAFLADSLNVKTLTSR